MGGPPKVKPVFVDPDDHEARKNNVLEIRSTVLNLRQSVGNDGWLEGLLIDSLRYIGYSQLNAESIIDERNGYSQSLRSMKCKHPTLAACLYYQVLNVLASWHQFCSSVDEDTDLEPAVEYAAYRKQLSKLNSVVKNGLYNAMVKGNDREGHEYVYEV